MNTTPRRPVTRAEMAIGRALTILAVLAGVAYLIATI